MPTIVTVSGTSRPGNYTSRALALVEARLQASGAQVASFDARDLHLAFPGQPPTDDARRLREAVTGADGVVLATPEYHGSYSAVAKLVIENLGFPSALKHKPMALLGVASGRIGAIKSLEHLRGVCAHVGALVLPSAVSIAGVQKLFDADGTCRDAATQEALHGVADGLLRYVKDYVCPKHVLEAMVRSEGGDGWTAEV